MRDCWPLVITCQLIPYTFRSTAQKVQCPHILRLALIYPYSVHGFIEDFMDLGLQFQQDSTDFHRVSTCPTDLSTQFHKLTFQTVGKENITVVC